MGGEGAETERGGERGGKWQGEEGRGDAGAGGAPGSRLCADHRARYRMRSGDDQEWSWPTLRRNCPTRGDETNPHSVRSGFEQETRGMKLTTPLAILGSVGEEEGEFTDPEVETD